MTEMTPTIVLVHGAFADSASWDGVVGRLPADGPRDRVRQPAAQVATDAALLTDLVRSIDGPVVLVGHSYGGAVMTAVPADAGDVVALVYVAGFALTSGESAGDASALVPGSTLGDTLTQRADLRTADRHVHRPGALPPPVLRRPAGRAGGTHGGQPATCHRGRAVRAAGGQPLWRSVPSWFIFGELDHNIPAGAHRIMAERAGPGAPSRFPAPRTSSASPIPRGGGPGPRALPDRATVAS